MISQDSTYKEKLKYFQDQNIIVNIRQYDNCICWHTLNFNFIKTEKDAEILRELLNEDRTRIKTLISKSEINFPDDWRQIDKRHGMKKILKSLNFTNEKLKEKLKLLRPKESYENFLSILISVIRDDIDREKYLNYLKQARKIYNEKFMTEEHLQENSHDNRLLTERGDNV